MTPQEALSNMDKVSAERMGTRNDHAILQESVRTLAGVVEQNQSLEAQILELDKKLKGVTPPRKTKDADN